MARRKAAAGHQVPTSTREAAELVGDYVALDRKMLRIMLEAQLAIDAIKAARDARLAECAPAQKSWFAAIKAWWQASGAGELAGKKRSAELAGAKLGIRLTTPALKLPKGKTATQILDDLMGWLGGDFIRTKHELDKEAIIAALRQPLGEDASAEQLHDRRVLATELRLTVTQTDEFFIDTGLDEAAIRASLTPGNPSTTE